MNSDPSLVFNCQLGHLKFFWKSQASSNEVPGENFLLHLRPWQAQGAMHLVELKISECQTSGPAQAAKKKTTFLARVF
jgi:hypothetical protein